MKLSLVALLLGAALVGMGEEAQVQVTQGVRHVIPLGNLHHVCALDCIASLEEPHFVPAAQARLRGGATVIGLEIDGQARAYPLARFKEVVNDRVGDTPVLITWCPLCGTAIAFVRLVDGQEVEFGVSGKLHNSDLVLYDRTSFTLWQQITGQAVVGPLVPARLQMLPVDLGRWDHWRQRHPQTLVLAGGTFTGDDRQRLPYERVFRTRHASDRPALDLRLPPP